MQTCFGQSSDIASGIETRWRAHCGGRNTERGLLGLPAGREGKDAGDKRRIRTEMGQTSSEIRTWQMWKDSTVTELVKSKGEGCWF